MADAKDIQQKRPMSSKKRESIAAWGFLLPNLLGFLAFTSIPVLFSLAMAFMHWNIFKHPSFVGMENFRSLLWFHHEGSKTVSNDPFFWQYVYNTVYLMIGIPFGMAASLLVALVMNQKLKGIVLFRTIYFLPSVCSGVAMLILWKYLYNADIGLINKSIRAAGEMIFAHKASGLALTGFIAIILGIIALGIIAALLALIQWLCERIKLSWPEGMYKALTVLAGIAIFVFIGAFGRHALYESISFFFTKPPDWLGTVQWAKPSLVLMGLWAALGGYNMILYLAALQGVPTSYYEAAEIDGAGPWGKFWAVTWPMISPTTFFILIMSVIGGFQTGFMTADVMTQGGPAGSTTTIEYYLYQTAFMKFNMGYASAIAWFMFAVIFILTIITWRLGGRVVTYE